MPTPEDLNPKRRFIDNQLIAQLRKNKAFKVTFPVKEAIVDKLSSYSQADVQQNDGLGSSMRNICHPRFTVMLSDRKFVINLITRLFAESEDLESNFEEQSIYWNDDMEYVTVMIEKTLKKFKPESGENALMMPLFKNKEDEDFVKILIPEGNP